MSESTAGWDAQVARLVADRGDLSDTEVAGWVSRLPAGYRERTSPVDAATDLLEVPHLGTSGHRFGVRHDLEARPGTFRLRRLATTPVELSTFLPLLESFGLAVVEAVPAHLAGVGGSGPFHLDDFGLRQADEVFAAAGRPGELDEAAGRRLVDALDAIVAGDAEVDSLNRLVLASGVGWRQVALLRAYRRYRCVAAGLPDGHRLDDPLVARPAVARTLLRYFEARFDPHGEGPQGPSAKAARAAVVEELEGVGRFEEDQVLRTFLALVDATLRTNWFAPEGAGQGPVVLKFDSRLVPGLPSPRPKVETFVHSPRIEGIHLRAGSVARGGIRWSNRIEDFRMEVLDLVAAQVKKNAIIVPTGGKGGFVWRAGNPTREQVRRAYETFVGGLLDVTDNVVAGEVVAPVVRADGDDPYLVVAADRGTASYSDLANRISRQHGFWLGDAFASGGSTGYDHKAMGITARGAWTAVVRHFRHLDVNVEREPVRVAGVGDMSGDVFGNAMLLSRSIRLVAAFDHRHIFVDPDPVAEVSYSERQRLLRLDRSSWADYDRRRLSAGGGVWSRDTARIDLPAEAVAAIGVGRSQVTPVELISAILRAPVDLLFLAGIGTFIKAPGEPDAEVADHANDAVRVTTDQVRARVVAEGGNLGITQRGRIRYSRRGGRINTDFIDNAAGVATSDREVNLKILLGVAADAGRLDLAGRNAMLAAVEHDVAADVLREVDHSVAALDRAVPGSADDLPAYAALLVALESRGLFTRAVEALPGDEELATREAAGAGLIRPELAVLLAYAKLDLVGGILDSSLPDSPAVAGLVADYFPAPIRQSFGDLIPAHRLYRELAATALAGELVDRMGITWAHETAEELGRAVAEVAGCWWAAGEVLDARRAWDDVEDDSARLGADEEGRAHAAVAGTVAALARTYLRAGGDAAPEKRIATDRPVAQELGGPEPSPAPHAGLAGPVTALAHVGIVAAVHRRSGRPVADAAAAVAAVDGATGAGLLTERIAGIEPAGRWSRWQAQALLEDLETFRQAAAAAALLESSDGDPDAADAVAVWARRRQPALTRARRAATQLPDAGQEALALAALAVRELLATVDRGPW